MDEEQFEKWAQQWLKKRAERVGELRALPMTQGPARGAHVDRGAPRLVVRWDGYQWESVTVAPDFESGQRLVFGHGDGRTVPGGGEGAPAEQPRGRHRKPQA